MKDFFRILSVIFLLAHLVVFPWLVYAASANGWMTAMMTLFYAVGWWITLALFTEDAW